MKKRMFLPMLLMMSLTLLSAMCSSDDDEMNTNNNNTAEIQAVEDTVESGNWVITYFYDTDHEETAHFTGYVFNFLTNGTLTASNGTNTYNGTWSVTDDSSSSSSSSDDIDFNIFFSSPADFAELSDDWDIQMRTSNKIELIDVSGGNGGTDYLTFEKQ